MSEYAIAQVCFGGQSKSLRVRVTRREYGCVWVVTADIQDAGTALVLDDCKVQPEPAESLYRHTDGLVLFA